MAGLHDIESSLLTFWYELNWRLTFDKSITFLGSEFIEILKLLKHVNEKSCGTYALIPKGIRYFQQIFN